VDTADPGSAVKIGLSLCGRELGWPTCRIIGRAGGTGYVDGSTPADIDISARTGD
jgi:hypothetical protein